MSLDKPLAQTIDGSARRFLVVAACYNKDLVDAVLNSAISRLREAGVPDDGVDVLRVPGSGEVPYAVQLGLDTGEYDACVALGVLIRGGTNHHAIIAQSVTDALQMTALNLRVPVINGIIVAESREQAVERAAGGMDRGREFAEAALTMADLRGKREVVHVG